MRSELIQLAFTSCLISLALPCAAAKFQVSQLSDLDLGIWQGVGGRQGGLAFCIRSTPQSPYQLTAQVAENPIAFNLISGVANLPFSALFSDTGSNAGLQPLTAGVPLTGLGPGATSKSCNKGLNGYLEIRLAETNLQQATPGIYSGTLVLIIGPE